MDHRDSARQGRMDGLRPDHERMVLIDEDGDLGSLPARYEVCWTCDGRGKHVNPSVDSHGISAAEFDEDPDFREDYCRGVYDVTCYECGGRRVTLQLDRNACPKEALEEIDKRVISESSYRAECAAERRMGA